jgi:hypothetical protein
MEGGDDKVFILLNLDAFSKLEMTAELEPNSSC